MLIGQATHVTKAPVRQRSDLLEKQDAANRGGAVLECKVVWLKRLLKNINESVNKPILIH